MTSLCSLLTKWTPAASAVATRATRFPNAFQQPRRMDHKMIDHMDHCTGIEKREREATKAGIKDPFNMKALERGPGTKECPNLVPSAFDARIVGCVCHPEQRFINWMWVIKDMPKRCECGYWFKLVEVPAF